MEKKLTQKLEDYVAEFSEGIMKKVTEFEISEEAKKDLLDYITSYGKLNIEKSDLLKRKRQQVVVPSFLRCSSKRSDGDQCSRRKKDGCEFCGTHSKGSPYGTFAPENIVAMTKVEVWAQDIGGILYYIDNDLNVYQTEDIINNKTNPRVVSKCEKHGEKYSIPSFHI
jgi:hypothetical protein